MREEAISLGSLPTVKPADIVWLDAAKPLLLVPPGSTILLADADPPAELLPWVAFFSAAEVCGAKWGVRRGAVRTTTIEVASRDRRIDVVGAFDRLALLWTARGAPEGVRVVAARLQQEVATAHRFSMDWAAAAHTLHVLETQ